MGETWCCFSLLTPCFLSATFSYLGLLSCPLMPRSCPLIAPAGQPPRCLTSLPQDSQVYLYSSGLAHRACTDRAYADRYTQMPACGPQVLSRTESASPLQLPFTRFLRPEGQELALFLHLSPVCSPHPPTQSCKLFLQNTSQFISFLSMPQPPADFKPSSPLAWTIAGNSHLVSLLLILHQQSLLMEQPMELLEVYL